MVITVTDSGLEAAREKVTCASARVNRTLADWRRCRRSASQALAWERRQQAARELTEAHQYLAKLEVLAGLRPAPKLVSRPRPNGNGSEDRVRATLNGSDRKPRRRRMTRAQIRATSSARRKETEQKKAGGRKKGGKGAKK